MKRIPSFPVLPSFLVLAAISAILPACGGSITAVEEHELDGEWRWVRATGGIAGVEISPQTEGYDLELRIGADGSVELLRDGVLQVSTTFRILAPSGEPGAPEHLRIAYDRSLFGGWEEQYLVAADGSNLVLADPCCDGYTWEFVAEG